MRFVLDSSVVMRWFFGDGSEHDLAYADRVLELLTGSDAVPAAPAIWPLEAANVIVRAEATGAVTEARSAEFIELLGELAVEVDHGTAQHALNGTLQLARRFRLSSYDASYLELALREGLALATLDADQGKAADQAGVPRVLER